MRPMNSKPGKPAMKAGGKKAPTIDINIGAPKKAMPGTGANNMPVNTPPAPMKPSISTKPPMFPGPVTPPLGTSGKGMPTIDPMNRFRGK